MQLIRHDQQTIAAAMIAIYSGRESISEVAERLKVSAPTIYQWVAQVHERGVSKEKIIKAKHSARDWDVIAEKVKDKI